MQIYNYSLEVEINSEEHAYKCHETIKFNGNEEKLILNSVNLLINKIKINGANKNFKFGPKNQEIIVDGIITKDSTAEIEFTGKIPEQLQGFYLSKTRDGEMFTTQFEPTGARRFFPCVDNPSYKATFDIEATFDEKYSAISNMPVEKEEKIDGKKKVKFFQTPLMSTYLLYLGIGEFEEKNITFSDTKKLILAAQKGHLTASDYPLEIAKKAIEFYENYFDIKYPLPKEHLISVPEFGAGAMENWGAITFREIYLNMSDSTSETVRKSIGEVIAHELAHQWFGDLVTMAWWDDLWLNESFATFMSYMIMDKLEPEFDMFSDFLVDETEGALAGDSLVTSHPIEVEVKSPDDISQIFDEISYGKGGSILRMIHAFVGDEVFRDGLRLYLKNYSYKNASGADLWEYISRVSDMPVRKVMESFIQNIGYPVVDAELVNDEINLNQSRFLLNGKTQHVQWKIPLTIKYMDRVESLLFEDESMKIEYTGKLLKLNNDETGFYRVSYSDNFYGLIIKNLKYLSNKDIFGIINDLYAFLLSGKINLNDYLERIKPLMELNDTLIIREISNGLFMLHLILPENEVVSNKNNEFHKAKLAELGKPQKNENINITIARGIISSRLASMDNEYAEMMAKEIDNIKSISPDMRSTVLISYARNDNNGKKLLELISSFDQDEDRVKAIQALGFLDGKDNYELIEKAISSKEIKAQDSMRYYISAAKNRTSSEYIYKNLKNIINSVQKVFEGSGYSSHLVEAIVPYIGLAHSEEIATVLQNIEFPEISRGIKKGLEYLNIYKSFISNVEKQ
ncbi:MAG: M1 family metallopeptidase [Ferroplasma sp.]